MSVLLDPIAQALASERHADWLRRSSIQAPAGRYLQPTIGQKLRRMSAFERGEVQAMLQSMQLRQAVRHTLYMAFHGLLNAPRATSMQRLRAAVHEQESNATLQTQLNEQRVIFEPHVTTSDERTTAEVNR